MLMRVPRKEEKIHKCCKMWFSPPINLILNSITELELIINNVDSELVFIVITYKNC